MRRRRRHHHRRPHRNEQMAAALARSDYELVALCVLDAAVEAINILGAATIDDALALLDEQETDHDRRETTLL